MGRSFRANLISAASGASAAQAIDLLGMIVVARWYATDAVGAYSVILAVLAMVAVLATGRYERAIVLASSATERDLLLVWCAFLSLAVGVCTTVGLTCWAVITNASAVTLSTSLFAGMAVVVGGAGLATEYAALREGRFRLIATAKICGAVGGALVRCLPVAGMAPTTELLAASLCFGPAITCGLIGWQPLSRSRVSWRGLVRAYRVAWRHRSVALDLVPASFLNTASGQVPNIVVAQLLGVSTAAQFFLGQRVLLRPMGIVINSIADAGLHDAAGRPRHELREIYRRRAMGLARLAVTGVVICWLAGPLGVRLVFGTGWEVAGSVLGILAVGVGVQLVFTPFSNFFLVIGATGVYVKWAAFRLGVVVTSVAGGVLSGYGVTGAAVGLAFGQALSFIVQHVILWRHLEERNESDSN